MIMNRLNSELRGHAVSYGLCTQWQGDWQNNKSQQELIGMYIYGALIFVLNTIIRRWNI